MTTVCSSLVWFALTVQTPLPSSAPNAPSSTAPAPGTAGTSTSTAATVATVNGEPLELAHFRDWLVATHGWRHLDDYIDLTLLQQATVAAGLPLASPAEIEAAFEQDWQDQILMRHRGEEADWLTELAGSGLDRTGYRYRRMGTLEQEVLAKRLLKQRPMTEAQLKELWEREFGNGVRTRVRIAFFDQLKGVRPGQQVNKEAALELAAAAKTLADRFLQTVQADRSEFAKRLLTETDLCTIARFDSYLSDTRTQGGEIARLRADHFGGALEPGLASAKSGDLVGPIATPQGLYVVEVLERSPAPFDAVGDELRAIWRDRFPSPGEVHALKQELRQKAKIERFPLHQ